MPLLWESTGVETHFTNGLDPEPRARNVFAFVRSELLVQWLAYLQAPTELAVQQEPCTFLKCMREMPKLVTEWGSVGAHYQLWPAPINAIENLEKSLAANKPKALIQMATGSGKTFTSIGFIYRLIKFGEEYIVQHLQSNQLDTSARVVTCPSSAKLKQRSIPTSSVRRRCGRRHW